VALVWSDLPFSAVAMTLPWLVDMLRRWTPSDDGESVVSFTLSLTPVDASSNISYPHDETALAFESSIAPTE